MSPRMHAWAEYRRCSGVAALNILLTRRGISFAVIVGPPEDTAAPSRSWRSVSGWIGAAEGFPAQWARWRGELAAVAILSAFPSGPSAALTPLASASGIAALGRYRAALVMLVACRLRSQVRWRQKVRGRLGEVPRSLRHISRWLRSILGDAGHVIQGNLTKVRRSSEYVWRRTPIDVGSRHVSDECHGGRSVIASGDYQRDQNRNFHNRDHCTSDPDCNNSQRPSTYWFCPHVESHGGERLLFAVFSQILVGEQSASHVLINAADSNYPQSGFSLFERDPDRRD